MTFSDSDNDGHVTAADIKQINHYYPFGLNMEGNWNGAQGNNKYQYNGKEWNDDFGLGWNDYGARFYDPSVARWWNVDPLSEMYYQYQPYNYVLNMPTKATDPDGKSCANCGANGESFTPKPLIDGSTCICAQAGGSNTNDWILNKKTNKLHWDPNIRSDKDIKDHNTYEYFGPAGTTYSSEYGEVILGSHGLWSYTNPLVAASNFNSTLSPTQSVLVNNVGTGLGIIELNSEQALKKLNRLRDLNSMKAAYEPRHLTPEFERELSKRASIAEKFGTFGKYAGRAFAAYGAITTIGDVYTGRKSPERGMADLVMTAVGVYGGAPGLIISGIYFVGTTVYDLYK